MPIREEIRDFVTIIMQHELATYDYLVETTRDPYIRVDRYLVAIKHIMDGTVSQQAVLNGVD